MTRCIVLVAIFCLLARYTDAVNECTVHDNCRNCRDGAVVVRDAQNPSKLVYGGGHCFLNAGDVCVDMYTHLPCSGDASACPADAMSNVVAEYLQPAWYQSCDDQKKKYVMGPAGCLDGADSIGSCAPQYWTQTTTTTTTITTQNTTTTSNSTTTIFVYPDDDFKDSAPFQDGVCPTTDPTELANVPGTTWMFGQMGYSNNGHGGPLCGATCNEVCASIGQVCNRRSRILQSRVCSETHFTTIAIHVGGDPSPCHSFTSRAWCGAPAWGCTNSWGDWCVPFAGSDLRATTPTAETTPDCGHNQPISSCDFRIDTNMAPLCACQAS